jgi:lysophospholipase L1-like esterase
MLINRQWASVLLAGLIIMCGIRVKAQTNFSVNATGVVRGGTWTIQNGGGHNAITDGTPNRQLDFMVTGTACVFSNYYATGSNMGVTVRNASGTVEVATFTPTVTINSWQTNLTLFSGLTDTPHWVTLRFPSQWLVDSDNTFGVTGAAPALTYPTGFGLVTELTAGGTAAHLLVTNFVVTVLGGNSAYLATYPDSEIWFYATGDSIWVRTSSNLGKIRLINVDTGNTYVATEGNTGWEWIRVATGQGTSRHLYRMSESVNVGGGQTFGVTEMMTDAATAGSGLDLTATIPAKPVLTVYGDSITEGTLGTGSQSWQAFGRRLAESQNYALYNLGFGGTNVSGTGNSGETTLRTNLAIASNATYCVILYGTNDLHSNIATGTFQTSYQNMLTKLVTGMPACKFIVLGILPTIYDSHTQPQVDAYSVYIQNAIAATLVTNPSAHIQYVSTTPWNLAGAAYAAGGAYTTFSNTPNFYTGDGGGLHPNAAGYTVMASDLAPYVTAFVPPLFRRSNGGRPGSRSSAYYISPRILEQLGCSDLAYQEETCAH